jgi:tetratricopeptide (TPR) repeat protein
LNLGVYNFLDPKEAMPKAKDAALKAIEIDSTLAEAHTSLARIKLATELNAADPDLEKEFKRAIELNPNLANAHARYGNFLMLIGRSDESLIETRRAQELDPLSLRINNTLALALASAGRLDEAIEQYKRTLEMDPDYTTARYNLAEAYKYKGMYKEAIAEMQKVIEAEGTADLGTLAILGSMYAASGNRAEAEKLLVKIKSTKQPISSVDLANLYTALGDKEQAIASLQKAYEDRDNQLIQIKALRDFDLLRSDPRFQDLLRRIGLTP